MEGLDPDRALIDWIQMGIGRNGDWKGWIRILLLIVPISVVVDCSDQCCSWTLLGIVLIDAVVVDCGMGIGRDDDWKGGLLKGTLVERDVNSKGQEDVVAG